VNLKETGIEDMKWIHLAKDMVQWWTQKLGNETSGFTKGLVND
jgi:hypothetical protein